MTVTLTVHVKEVGLIVNGSAVSGAVPVIGAAIQIEIWNGAGVAGTGNLVTTDPATPATDSNGDCTFKFSVDDGTNVHAYALTRSASQTAYGTTYELDGITKESTNGDVTKTGPYEAPSGIVIAHQGEENCTVLISGAPIQNETDKDPHDIPWPTVASAFVVFSALTLPLNLAQSIGAALPPRFAVDYPNDINKATEAGDFDGTGQNSGQTCPTLNLTTYVMGHPSTIFHEFGHMVAASNGFGGGPGGDHAAGSNARATSSDGAINDGGASEGNLELAFNEGWADYYAVATSDFETSSVLNIPGFGHEAVEPTDRTGVGEDDELSVAETLLAIDEVGIKANGNAFEATIEPYGTYCLFSMLKDSGISDLAEFYQALDMQYANAAAPYKYYATIGRWHSELVFHIRQER